MGHIPHRKPHTLLGETAALTLLADTPRNEYTKAEILCRIRHDFKNERSGRSASSAFATRAIGISAESLLFRVVRYDRSRLFLVVRFGVLGG